MNADGDINAAVIPKFDIQGKQVYISFGNSMMSDNTAFAFVYLDNDKGGIKNWHIEQHSFIPWNKAGSIEAKEKQDGINYRELEKQGLCTIKTTPEGIINSDQVYRYMLEYIGDNNLEIMLFSNVSNSKIKSCIIKKLKKERI